MFILYLLLFTLDFHLILCLMLFWFQLSQIIVVLFQFIQCHQIMAKARDPLSTLVYFVLSCFG